MRGEQNVKFCLSLDESDTVKHYINHTEYISEADINQAHAAADR